MDSNKKSAAEPKAKQEKTISQKPLKTKHENKYHFFTLYSLVIILILLSVGIYYLLSMQYSRLELSVRAMPVYDALIENHEKKMQGLVSSLANMQKEVASVNGRLDELANEAVSDDTLRAIHKALYFLELCQVNAHWSLRINDSIQLISQADNALKPMKSNSILSVRQHLAKIQAKLEAFKTIDVAGMLSQLDALQMLVSKAPIKTIPTINREDSSATEPQTSYWKYKLRDSIHMLEKLVVIRQHSEPVNPILSEAQALLMREQINLNIEQAKWAILQKDAQLYQLSLKQAYKDAHKILDNSNQSARVILSKLKKLQTISINLPSIQLDTVIEQLRHMLKMPKPQSSNGDNFNMPVEKS